MAAIESRLVTHRGEPKNKMAIVFVHGFLGDPATTWCQFPEFVMNDKRMSGWNVYSLGYPTSYWLDFTGIWKADPPIPVLADGLRTTATLPPLADHTGLAIVAHSMGGLVVQKALVDDPQLVTATSHLIVFGTPSNGLVKAGFFKFWKQQLQGMAQGGDFVVNLRQRWTAAFPTKPPFELLAVAGDQDEFVPRSSSVEVFPEAMRRIVPGDHLSIVHAKTPSDVSVALVIKCLTGVVQVGAPEEAAGLTAERIAALATIAEHCHKPDLDEARLVQLALALEYVGRQDEAIERLETQIRPQYAEAMGALAGRYKRRWLVGGSRSDAEHALKRYLQGYQAALVRKSADLLLYLGINVAFMRLAFEKDEHAARLMATTVLGHCAANPHDKKWAEASAGEASLLLGDADRALKHYRTALKAHSLGRTDLWRQNLSMFQQAIRVASLVGNVEAAEQLSALFRGTGA
jgi:pimeloyl-ACP methyl ester carboxylesterase